MKTIKEVMSVHEPFLPAGDVVYAAAGGEDAS